MNFPDHVFDFDCCELEYYEMAREEYRKKHPEHADNIDFVEKLSDSRKYELWLKAECPDFCLFLESMDRIENEHECKKYMIHEMPGHLSCAITSGFDNNHIIQRGKRMYDTDKEVYDVIYKINRMQEVVKDAILAEERNDLSTLMSKLKEISDCFGCPIITAEQLNRRMKNLLSEKDKED